MEKLKMSNAKFRAILIPIISVLVAVILVGTIVANMYYGTLDWRLGRGQKHIVNVVDVPKEKLEYYKNNYSNSKEALLASADMSTEIGNEGEVLLKNINATLPIVKKSDVTPFGYRYISPVYGGTGSGKVDASKDYVMTAEKAINEYFNVNKTVENRMKGSSVQKLSGDKVLGLDDEGYRGADQRIHNYNSSIYNGLEASCNNTVGIVFIGRNTGEGADLFRDPSGYKDGTAHHLALTENEKNMLKFAKDNCSKVVVIINSSSIVEIQELQNDDGIGAILWIGSAGARGMSAMAKILSGETNPSGKTVDTWIADFVSDPVFTNYGGSTFDNLPSLAQNYAKDYIEYEEGIYMGYRYYETKFAVDNKFDVFGQTKTYDDAVIYPFGYGLNYQDDKIEQAISEMKYSKNKVTVTGTIKNNSSLDVKEVVQIYFASPYSGSSKIQKSEKTLVAFDKIAVKAGQSKEFTISINDEDMASYDYKGYYTKGKGSYVLEKGDYNIYLAKDSHNSWASEKVTVPNTLVYSDTAESGSKQVGKRSSDAKIASNLFDYVNEYVDSDMMTVMSRSDFDATKPTAPVPKSATDKIKKDVGAYDVNTDEISGNQEGSKLYKSEAPVSNAKNGMVLSSLRGLDYDDPLWSDLLDNIDYSSKELKEFITYGFYKTGKLEAIGKVETADRDGPVGLTAGGANALQASTWMSTPIVAATWNVELAYKMGECIAQEALNHNVNGWYAPGLNLHRSPFGGRNFEYFSEDPVITGKMGANLVSGAQQNGLYTYVKHFALNDQETNRITGTTWVDEQAMREIYFKAFEICVKEAAYELTYYDGASEAQKTVTRKATTALMSGMNSIGGKFCGTNYELLTGVLREEWNFEGMVITDMTLPNEFKSIDEAYRVGNDVWMYMLVSNTEFTTPTAMWAARKAVHNVCYAVVNSATYNYTAPGAYIYYDMSPWKIALIVMNVVIYLAAAAAVVWMVLRSNNEKKNPDKYKKRKSKKA